jgi:ligand-binding sensor domain-containing protein
VRRIFEDSKGNLWFGTNGDGVCRYDGKSFTNFYLAQGLDSPGVQCTYEDREGRVWAGGYLGLYRLEAGSFIKIGKNGPW